MSRIKLELPLHFAFKTEIKIRITDLNYGGHVGNDVILSLMHETRVQYLQDMDYGNEIDAIEGMGLIQTDTAIVYKAETFYGDSLLVEVVASDFTKYGFDFFYKFTKKGSKVEVARGKTGVVCFDYKVHKIAPLPEGFKAKLQIEN